VIITLAAALLLTHSAPAVSVNGPGNNPTVRLLTQNLEISPSSKLILVVLDTSAFDWDEFVPMARKKLLQIRKQNPLKSIVLCLPMLPNGNPPTGSLAEVEGESEEKREAREVLAERTEAPWFAPSLLAQAARDLQIPTLNLESATEHGRDLQGLRDAVEDLSPTTRTNKMAWSLVSFTSDQPEEGPAKNAIDGDPTTYWHSQYDPKTTRNPHELVIDLGKSREVGGISYLPRQDGGTNGSAKAVSVYVSDEVSNWGAPAGTGEFKNGTQRKRLRFAHSVTGRYLKFIIVNAQNGEPYASAAEIDIIGPLLTKPSH
jgi:F5/8 type C domain